MDFTGRRNGEVCSEVQKTEAFALTTLVIEKIYYTVNAAECT